MMRPLEMVHTKFSFVEFLDEMRRMFDDEDEIERHGRAAESYIRTSIAHIPSVFD